MVHIPYIVGIFLFLITSLLLLLSRIFQKTDDQDSHPKIENRMFLSLSHQNSIVDFSIIDLSNKTGGQFCFEQCS